MLARGMDRAEPGVTLCALTEKNYEAALDLRVHPEQQDWIAPVVKSLADSYIHAGAEPRLVFAEDRLVGFVMVYPWNDGDERVVTIVRLMIDERFQGRGYGRAALRESLAWARAMEPTVSRFSTSTKPDNRVALDLYKSAGFKPTGKLDEDGEVILVKTDLSELAGGWGAPRAVELSRMRAARKLIRPAFLASPCLSETRLDIELGARVALKLETLNPIRSFKGRGTDFLLSQLPGCEPIVCASAGNFGLGVAFSAKGRGRAVTVFAAKNANPMKLEAMRRLGAEVVLHGVDFDSAKEAARGHARERALPFIEDGAEPELAEGAGTIALELLEQVPAPEYVVLPLGNGALSHGVGTALKALSPRTTLVCVTACGAPAMYWSLAREASVTSKRAYTVADGIAVRNPVPYATKALIQLRPEVMEVSEEALFEAVHFIHRELGLVVEPAGAAGVAALLSQREVWRGRSVATVLAGGNVDPSRFQQGLAL